MIVENKVKNVRKLLEVIDRLEKEDKKQREDGMSRELRNRSLARESAQFLSLLVSIIKPETVIEIGTSVGYSTLWLGMSASMVGAKVISYDVSKEKVLKARKNISEAGLNNIIEVKLEDPSNARLSRAEMVFIDVEKEDYIAHFEAVIPVLKDGGVIIADNVISHAEDLEKYLSHVREYPGCMSMMVPIGKGLELTFKHGKGLAT